MQKGIDYNKGINISTYLLLGILFKNKPTFKSVFGNIRFSNNLYNKPSLIGAYSRDVNRPYLNEHIFLLISIKGLYDKDSKYLSDVSYLQEHRCFYSSKTYKIDEIDYLVLTFTVPTELRNEYRMIKEGNYDISSTMTYLRFCDIRQYDLTYLYFNSDCACYKSNSIYEKIKDILDIKNDELPESDFIEYAINNIPNTDIAISV